MLTFCNIKEKPMTQVTFIQYVQKMNRASSSHSYIESKWRMVHSQKMGLGMICVQPVLFKGQPLG